MESVGPQRSFNLPGERWEGERGTVMEGIRGVRERGGGDKSLGGLCSCFHLKLDSDHNNSSSLCSGLSLVSLEGFPLPPFEETTAPARKGRHRQERALGVTSPAAAAVKSRPRSGGTDKAGVLASYLVSSATSTSAGAVMGALECPAVGSSVFSSPLVELITCREEPQQPTTHTRAADRL